MYKIPKTQNFNYYGSLLGLVLKNLALSVNFMMNYLTLIAFLFFYSFTVNASEFDTLTVMTYNILNFNDKESDSSRIDDFRMVIEDINPDILVVQELISRSGGELFLNEVMNYSSSEYGMAPFYDGYNTDNLLYYRNSVLDYLSTKQIHTSLRDISAYTVSLKNSTDSNFSFVIYSAHLKASQDCEQERYEEVLYLKNHVESLPSDTYYMVAGDFNLYDSYESAYKVLMDSMAIDLFDPIESPGDWHDSYIPSEIHTQSTRKEVFGGGASGGLDDRFDFILMSEQFKDSDVMHYVEGTYLSFGNDGNHLNKSINVEPFDIITQEMANALYEASDHLPVVAKICYETSGSKYCNEPKVADELNLLTAYPNPFNNTVNIKIEFSEAGDYEFSIVDIFGKLVWTTNLTLNGRDCYILTWNGMNLNNRSLSSGVYFANLSRSNRDNFNEKIAITLLK